jgi:hypothetical protein
LIFVRDFNWDSLQATGRETMSQFEFRLATPDDDAELRGVLSSIPMAGQVSLVFAREPSFFGATAVDGKSVQVVTVRDRATGRIIGMGTRAIGPRFVGGQPTSIGYLSGLRLLPEYHGRAGLLARGYRFLRALHQDGQTPFYLTTVAVDNTVALRTLTNGRAGLPTYHSLGNYVTLAISAEYPKSPTAASQHVNTRLAEVDDRDLILKFLATHGPRRQFFPIFESPDLFEPGGWLQGLQPRDIMLAFDGDRLVGTLGAWDQSSFKQTIVHGYSRWLSLVRPVYNTVASIRCRPQLPAVGSVLEARCGAIPVVVGDDAAVFSCLIEALSKEVARRGVKLLLLGLHESDSLLPAGQVLAGREYVTRLYLVYWPDRPPELTELVQRVPYLELGCL